MRFYLFLVLSSGFSYSTSNFEYVYRSNSSKFYDFIDLESRLEYQESDLRLQKELRVQEHLKLKKEAYQEHLIYFVLPIGIIFSTYLAYENRPEFLRNILPNLSLPNIQIGFFGLFVSNIVLSLTRVISEPYSLAIQERLLGISDALKLHIFGPREDPLTRLELEYVSRKPEFSKAAQKAIESKVSLVRQQLFQVPMYSFQANKEDRNLLFLKQILDLPTESQEIKFNQESFRNKLAQYNDMGSSQKLDELALFASSIAISSRVKNQKLKSAIYLQGPPGVGKTEAVIKAAEALGIPVIKINLAELTDTGSIKGIRCEYAEDSRCTPGLIANNLIEASRRGYLFQNAILLFDEADQVLNRIVDGQSHPLVSFMLDLLEGKTTHIENPYFGTDIDVRFFGIALAGNQALISKALNSRLNIIEFGNYTKEYRIKAGRDKFIPEVLEGYLESLKIEDLTEADWKLIDEIAIKEHQKLEESGEDPGFRQQLREIERFIHKKALLKSNLK